MSSRDAGVVHPAGRRTYDSSRRRKQALEHRAQILESARRRFLEQGYGGTTLADIAADADVSVQTIYKGFKNKAGLLKVVFDVAVAGDDEPVPMIRRDFVADIAAEADPRRKLQMYAGHLSESMPRAAPIYLLARAVAATEPEIDDLHRQMRTGQLMGMGAFAAHLHNAAALRPGMTPDEARDILWTISSAEMYELLVLERGWSAQRYAGFLAQSLSAALLVPNS